MKLRFGTAGIPIGSRGSKTHEGIADVRTLGLESMELEFVRSINISEEKAPIVNESAKKNDVLLSCHGQYYINLNSLEEEKVTASIQRILKAARVAHLCGAFSMTFHAAYYMKQDPVKVYDKVRKTIKDIVKTLQNENNSIWIRPETTGKAVQFGTVDELLKLSTEVEQVMPCIDFSHLHARSIGRYNTYNEFSEVLEKVEKHLGKEGIKNMHIHVSGIAYGDKGEKNHLELKDSDMNYKDLMKAFKDFDIGGTVISESPNIEKDALLMQKKYNNI